jgi:tRNA A-37 threonylcarbamoyl transferase component Bud32
MIDRVRLFIARRLAAVRLHLWTDSSDGVRTKYRKWGADVSIVVGNRYLRIPGALSECLRCGEWIEWEVAIGQILGRNVQPLLERRGVALPFISGESLADLLKSTVCWGQKRQGLLLAGQALRDFHQRKVTACGIENWPLSHGDATSRNVIVDCRGGHASWIDFDMRHQTELPALARQADDLRVLIWSSAALVEKSLYDDTIATICGGYTDTEVIDEMRHLTQRTRQPAVFQLAQAPLSTAEFTHLRAIIRALRPKPAD